MFPCSLPTGRPDRARRPKFGWDPEIAENILNDNLTLGLTNGLRREDHINT
jgi:hypothetical protein